MSGPKSRVEQLKRQGLQLKLDLSRITEEELESLEKTNGSEEEEIRYFVPEDQKRIRISFQGRPEVEINDPMAAYLHLDFLKQELLPLGAKVPVKIYYPLSTSTQFNPDRFKLAEGGPIAVENGIAVLTTPLYVQNVSRLFVETVRDRLEIAFLASQELPWSVEFIDLNELEDQFVQASMAAAPADDKEVPQANLRNEYLRSRFRNFLRQFKLLQENQAPLQIDARISGDQIEVRNS